MQVGKSKEIKRVVCTVLNFNYEKSPLMLEIINISYVCKLKSISSHASKKANQKKNTILYIEIVKVYIIGK